MSAQRVDLSPAVIEVRPDNRAAGGMDPERLEQLTASVRQHGILQPLIVRRHLQEDRDVFQLIAGHRRLAAARIIGMQEVPCSVMEGTDANDVEVLSILENLQREDMHPLDEADGFARLEAMGLTRAQIAEQIGCSAPTVAARLRLVPLVPEVRSAWIEAPNLPVKAAEAIASMTPDMQRQFLTKPPSYHQSLNGMPAHAVGDWAAAKSDRLEHAPWDLADADLLPAAGACTTCPKRWDYQVDLFHGQHGDDDPAAPESRCGDRKCWKEKLKALVARSREQATENGVDLTDVTTGQKKGALPSYRVDRFDPKKHAKRKTKPKALLIVDGPEAGTVVDGYVKPEANPDAAHKRKLKKQRAERQARRDARVPALKAIAEAMDAHPNLVDVLTDKAILERLAIAVWGWEAEKAAAVHLMGAELDDYGHLVDKGHGTEAKKLVDAMDPVKCLLYVLAAADTLRTHTRPSDDERDDLALVAGLLEVDPPEAAK